MEFSGATSQVTHHIAADADVERDMLVAGLTAAKQVMETTWIDGHQKVRKGRNGGGDPWHTDGRLPVVKPILPPPGTARFRVIGNGAPASFDSRLPC